MNVQLALSVNVILLLISYASSFCKFLVRLSPALHLEGIVLIKTVQSQTTDTEGTVKKKKKENEQKKKANGTEA